MPARCFECGEIGHVVADCPSKNYAAEFSSRKPPWCGKPGCDEDTRLVSEMTDDGLKLIRCRHCHPNGNTIPATYAKCPRCRSAVYAWDRRTPCDQHKPVGKHLECKRGECSCHGQAA